MKNEFLTCFNPLDPFHDLRFTSIINRSDLIRSTRHEQISVGGAYIDVVGVRSLNYEMANK